MNNYYDVKEDLDIIGKFSDIWILTICGGRATGKTYSALKYCLENDKIFTFVKRTAEDVKMLCAGGKLKVNFDISPFAPINRDTGSNVKALLIDKGIGGFYKCAEDGEPEGQPIGYIVPLSLVHKVKGFDLSRSDVIIFDEFIPQPWERVNRKTEGTQFLDLYATISRDRFKRGLGDPIAICLANATDLANPLFDTLEIMDEVSMMADNGESIKIINGIMIHLLNDNEAFRNEEAQRPIYKTMQDTAWGKMALNNEFAYNDTSNVTKLNMKNFRPLFKVRYKKTDYYCYLNNNDYFITESKSNVKGIKSYNLDKENDQKRFYYDYVVDLYEACCYEHCKFTKYSIYNLIMNYKKLYTI